MIASPRRIAGLLATLLALVLATSANAAIGRIVAMCARVPAESASAYLSC